ncbi:hypothetical protein MTR67_012714 [Solanum verrucosum]|uniref:Uncharacterized protein n=1 Tax=Solanum verrucosum TaxID=315347 RepID=A0AAF0THR0_SOLVR|nr:hypothetical protein MTR67_012714 [Solanum verrucosum]
MRRVQDYIMSIVREDGLKETDSLLDLVLLMLMVFWIMGTDMICLWKKQLSWLDELFIMLYSVMELVEVLLVFIMSDQMDGRSYQETMLENSTTTTIPLKWQPWSRKWLKCQWPEEKQNHQICSHLR